MVRFTLMMFMLFSMGAHAQEAWTLQQCVDYALKNNISIKQSELSAESNAAQELQSKLGLLPNLNGFATHQYNFGQTIDRYTNTFASSRVQSNNFGASAQLTLFNGLTNYNQIKQNEYTSEASKFDAEKTKYDITMNIVTAYLQVLYNQEFLYIAKNQVSITEQQVERTKKLVDAGSVARGNLLTIESQLASEQLQLVNAQNNHDLALLNLALILNVEKPGGFRIQKPVLNLPPESVLAITPDQVFELSAEKMPEIKSGELKLKSAEQALSASKGGYYPSLTFSASIATGYSGLRKDYLDPQTVGYQPYYDLNQELLLQPITQYQSTPTQAFGKQFSGNVNKSIGFNLNLPIFNGWQVQTNIKRSKISVMNAKLNYENTRNVLRKNVYQAYADAQAGLKKYYANQKAVSALTESFKYTEQRYNVGLVNTIDYNDAKNKLNKSESDLLQAKYEYVFKTKILDFYQGKPLNFE